ncbi:MAG: ADP-ribosylglycohydrolase family protein [Planctomycetes bacterium]|nr:ADP-ribosylglycohydrolase family protein [Planctomycetota bacterium]
MSEPTPDDSYGASAVAEHERCTLLGLAVGDAFGTTLEFATLPERPFGPLLTGPHREIQGGGPFSLRPGLVTDDTQMASCLAESLRACRGFDLRDVVARYRSWVVQAFDVGNQTAEALARIARGSAPEHAAREHWSAVRGRKPAGNGALMRCAPIAVLLRDPEARRAAALADASVTHFDPRCQLASCAYVAALAAACAAAARPFSLEQKRAHLEAVLGAELERSAEALAQSEPTLRREVEAARHLLLEDLRLARCADPELYADEVHLQRAQGFVRVAFRLALWEAFHAPDFESGLLDIVNRGGDADTNGAIAGALLGALHGSIPERWCRTVLDVVPASALEERFHPRRLLALLSQREA